MMRESYVVIREGCIMIGRADLQWGRHPHKTGGPHCNRLGPCHDRGGLYRDRGRPCHDNRRMFGDRECHIAIGEGTY